MTFVLALLLAPFTLLTFALAIELFAGLRPLPLLQIDHAEPVRTVIVVPAHDEETVIGETLAALRDAATGLATILVVADNCRDSTADIVRRLDVEVIERSDPDRRGKGFALDFAKSHLKAPPDVVVVVDADCKIEAASIERLIAGCSATGRPCQASYVQTAALDGPPTLQLSTFAFFIKNVIRQRALLRIANRVHLLGTGMAFPWPLFERANLANGNIVEDLEMGLELAEAGHPPLMLEEAMVSSKPAMAKDTIDQRRRWEGGFLENALRAGPKMLARSLVRADVRGLWAAINVMIPPFALLILLDLAGLAIAAAFVSLAGARAWPILLVIASLLLAAIGLCLAWRVGGSRFLSLGGLARAPLYVVWKLPMYLSFMRSGAPKEWLRTRRG